MTTRKNQSARRGKQQPTRTKTRQKRRIFRPIPTTYKIDLKSFKFWRNSFLLFWIFSFLGHLCEYVWVALPLLVGQPVNLSHIPFFVVAAPYGFGALALIWFVWPFVVREKIGIVSTYFLSVVVTTAIEFICAAVIVFFMGNNPFWDYSDEPFNILGYVCLPNSLAFGFVATGMIYYIFPLLNNLLNKIKGRWLDAVSVILFVSYLAIQVYNIWFR